MKWLLITLVLVVISCAEGLSTTFDVGLVVDSGAIDTFIDSADFTNQWTEKKKFKEYQICVFETGDFEFCQCMLDQIVARYSAEDWDKNASAILEKLIDDGTVKHCIPLAFDAGS